MYAWLPVLAYRLYLLQGPSKGPHFLTSTGPHMRFPLHNLKRFKNWNFENLHVYYEKGYLLKLLNNIQIHDIENSSSF